MSRIYKINNFYDINDIIKEYQKEITTTRYYKYKLLINHNIQLQDKTYLINMIDYCLSTAEEYELISKLYVIKNMRYYIQNEYNINNINLYYKKLLQKFKYGDLIIGKFHIGTKLHENFCIFEPMLYSTLFDIKENVQYVYSNNKIDCSFYNWNNRFKDIIHKEL